MGGLGGLFSNPQSQPQVPKPVEKVPGLQNLGSTLLDNFMKIITGQQQQKPFSGYGSVYGNNGFFPGRYGTSTQPNLNTNMGNSGGFQNYITQQIQQALAPDLSAGAREN